MTCQRHLHWPPCWRLVRPARRSRCAWSPAAARNYSDEPEELGRRGGLYVSSEEEGWERAVLLEVIVQPGVSSIPTGLRSTIARESRDLQKIASGKGKGREGVPRG